MVKPFKMPIVLCSSASDPPGSRYNLLTAVKPSFKVEELSASGSCEGDPAWGGCFLHPGLGDKELGNK
jgi:hypothetical protein